MDIRKLQRVIVDGLEDVKGQNIAVFNTEHLSPLFERVIIASGTSNRQTKALASSVRESVKKNGFGVARIEGEATGEWIIVDCGAAVVHLMQPGIREYYHLEEIWGEKPVKFKAEAKPRGLPKASSEDDEDEAPARKPRAAKTAAAKKAPAKTVAKKAVPSRTGITRTVGVKAAAKKAPAKKAAVKTVVARKTLVLNAPDARKPAAKKAVARKAAPAKKVAAKAPARPTPAKKAPVKKAAAKKAPAKKSAARS